MPSAGADRPLVLVLLCTYNERDNVRPLIEGLLGLGVPGLALLVLDDQSPDGTAEAVEEIARARPEASLLRRPPPAGRGLAGRDGYLEALRRGAEAIVEMDADLSHRPQDLPGLLAALAGSDVAVGSRFVPGGRDEERSWGRRWLTRLSAAFARLVLGLPVRDANSGFRALTRRALEAVDPASLRSTGPAIVHEVYFRAVRAGLRIREAPITFARRAAGRSKLGFGKLVSGMTRVLLLRLGL